MLELADAMGQTMDDEERETVFAELQEYFLNECIRVPWFSKKPIHW